MKNLYYQSVRQSAKHFHSRQHGDHFDKGINPQYDYGNEEATKLSWWDDVTFIRNNYRVMFHGLIHVGTTKRLFDPRLSTILMH